MHISDISIGDKVKLATDDTGSSFIGTVLEIFDFSVSVRWDHWGIGESRRYEFPADLVKICDCYGQI